MSSIDESPEYEKAEYKFEDKPVLATMMVGGTVISFVLFFIFNNILSSLDGIIFRLFPFFLVILVLYISFKRGLEIDVLITINTKTGWIYAKNRIQFWEGYINQAVRLLVLQRNAFADDLNSPLVYKLFLELEDDTSYEVLLTFEQAQNAIEKIKKAENVIPIMD